MEVVKRTDGWWILDVPDSNDCGPYDTRSEAEDDRRGISRCFKYEDREGYITSDPKKGETK